MQPRTRPSKRRPKRNVVTVDVCPFCCSGSSDFVLYYGWNTCLVCDEDWRA